MSSGEEGFCWVEDLEGISAAKEGSQPGGQGAHAAREVPCLYGRCMGGLSYRRQETHLEPFQEDPVTGHMGRDLASSRGPISRMDDGSARRFWQSRGDPAHGAALRRCSPPQVGPLLQRLTTRRAVVAPCCTAVGLHCGPSLNTEGGRSS